MDDDFVVVVVVAVTLNLFPNFADVVVLSLSLNADGFF